MIECKTIGTGNRRKNLLTVKNWAEYQKLTEINLKPNVTENFTEETKRRIIGGNQVLSTGYSEEIYVKARALREKIAKHFNDDFAEVDIILSPVSTNLPPSVGGSLKNPHAMYMTDAYTVGFSLGGLPTLTAPIGTEIGVQITASKDQEALILNFAKFLEEL